MSKELAVLVCPPLDAYPAAPEDQPGCLLRDCPHCKNKMWLSSKKRSLLLFFACEEQDILLTCYDCFREQVKDNPDLLKNSKMMNIW